MHTQFIAHWRQHCIGDALTGGYFCTLASMAKIHAGIDEDLPEQRVGARVWAIVGRIS